MTQEEADLIASDWIDAWNSHDLDRILAHYADDIVFHSPKAENAVGKGQVKGIAALKDYWSKGLASRPGLEFRLIHAFAGFRSVALLYSDELGCEIVETLVLDEAGKAVCGTACYKPAMALTGYEARQWGLASASPFRA